MANLVWLLESKRKVLEELDEKLSGESKARASEDSHSKRKPRPCGMTIHTGVGCSYACTYCYIYDMGFPAKPRPYPLRPEEIVYALTLNPYVVPERTLTAYGSVTEPFLPETTKQAVSYMREVYRRLRLPTQVSTKSILTEEMLKEISLGDPHISILVTVVTLSNRRLEPRAPDPVERVRAAGISSNAGLTVSLFMRPIIPGITDIEAEKILNLAAESGIKSVVFGSLRVTDRILTNLGRCGADISEIKRRLSRPLKGSEQIEIRSADLKERIQRIAEDLGLITFRAACEANLYAHKRYCAMCSMGPCNIDFRPVPLEGSDIENLLEYLGIRYASAEVTDTNVKVTLREKPRNDNLRIILASTTYRRVILRAPRP